MSARSNPALPPDEVAESLFHAEHETLLRAILGNSTDGLFVVDAQNRILYANDMVRRILGPGFMNHTHYDPRNWSERNGLFYPDTRTPYPAEELPLYRSLRGEQPPEVDLFVRNAAHPEGRHFRVRSRPVRDSHGQLLGAITNLKDTHDQRQAEAVQRRSKLRFQLMLETAQEGVWMIDADRRTTYVNQYAATLLGYTPEEILGRHLFEFICQEELARSTQELATQESEGQAVLVHDFRLMRKDGTPVWTLIAACPVQDESGGYLGSLAMITDISQRRENEEKARRLNAELEQRISERTAQLEFSNRELESFAYSVAHDLRVPLRSISNFTQALSEDYSATLDSTGRDYLQRIRASSQRMAELIDGILAISRVNSAELVETDVDLSGLANTVAEQLQRWAPERTIRFQIQEGLVDRGDAQLLRLVLENLMGNAWKFTREKPVAEIAFGTLPGTGNGRVYFVRDNGAGFDMEYQKKLFGVFQRLHTQQEFEGHGVGLATVQRIIRRHKGRVWGEGRVLQGATFYFTLHELAGPPPASR
ncbi:MAG TPA: PAS domain S-box protein [Archangium sp.]|uniref:sensor histidine kinase n=1 Tax=Archangium sp. TaxID=1872627 RepID=UPI002E32DE00|nr:PAS domain S-box protein [Archangium sp.]HEX5753908.1 PAS domain S-box protein [Archangium sp.]